MNNNNSNQNEENDRYSVYEEYAKTLRTWFVAYGIGFPAVILSRKELFDSFKESSDFKLIISLFLIATALQIMISFLNKWAAWIRHNYFSRGKQNSSSYKIADWYSNQYGIDVFLEVITFLSFAYGTYLSYLILIK